MSTPYYNVNNPSGTTPVVVQGEFVDPYRNQKTSALIPVTAYGPHTATTGIRGGYGNEDGRGEWMKGEPQPKEFRDGIWALLFYAHLGVLVFCTARFAPQMAQTVAEGDAGGAQRHLSGVLPRFLEEESQSIDVDAYLDSIGLVLVSAGLSAVCVSSLAMGFMIQFSKCLIYTGLLFNLSVAGILTIVALAVGSLGTALMFGIGLLFSAYYTCVVWSRIPFAASNLKTAATAVRANFGLVFFAFMSLVISFLWSLWWAIAFISTSFALGGCDAYGNCDDDLQGSNGVVAFLFLVSYFWTAQVIKNIVHTTVAGTVGTFWFTPDDARNCCSRAVIDSYVRSITTSFGSICLGSLIVAIIQAMKEMAHSTREGNDSLLGCLAECVLSCIESLVEYFNQWAFVYVGVYGYSFMDAGKNVMSLFRSRGWSGIIADMLVDMVLSMVCLAIGILTGLVVVVVGCVFQLPSDVLAAAFLIGLVVGIVMGGTLLSLISSAVNATIVLYAEAPAEFQTNHPKLSEHMREAWRLAYPNEFRY